MNGAGLIGTSRWTVHLGWDKPEPRLDAATFWPALGRPSERFVEGGAPGGGVTGLSKLFLAVSLTRILSSEGAGQTLQEQTSQIPAPSQ